MPNYVTTFWRDAEELADVRAKLFRLGEYQTVDRREEAIDQVKQHNFRNKCLLAKTIC